MFTFEDLTKLDRSSVQTLLRAVEQDTLVLAMKGANDGVREFFFSNLSERAGRLLKEDLEVMGPMRLRDVDEAQSKMINLAGEDELVY